MLGCFLWGVLGLGALISLATYLLPFIFTAILPEQNLKKKYGASWAVVTGASSGIGKSITHKLAAQGINVVMVALDEGRESQVFSEAIRELEAKYPSISFRRCGVNLGKESREAYMKPIMEATADIQPNLIFNNAGFIATGLFAEQPLERVLANYHCNASATVPITHHFVDRIIKSGQKGAVFFTSSPAGFLPTPTSVIYGATKAFLTHFAMDLATELRPEKIDVVVVHPSPVATSFYAGDTKGLDTVKFFQGTATTPDVIASCFFKSIGRFPVHDQGYYSVAVTLIRKLFDINLMTFFMTRFVTMIGDYRKCKEASAAHEHKSKTN